MKLNILIYCDYFKKKRFIPNEYFKIKSIVICLILFTLNADAQNTSEKTNYTVAEWKPQEAVWAIWPLDSGMQQIISSTIKILSNEVPVNLVVSSDSLRDFALLRLKNDSVDFGKIKIINNSNAKGFIRDSGPWFMFDSNNLPAKAKFKWNNYGAPVNLTRLTTKKDSLNMGNLADELIGKMKLKTITSDIVIENGMLEINNNGVAICFMETVLQRNPDYDLPSLTNEMKKVLGLKKIIWLGSAPTMDKLNSGAKASNLFGYGANGHIDQYVRFANDSTVLIAQINEQERRFDPVTSADYFILKDNLEYLRKATDENDHPFNIVEVPVPSMRFYLLEDSVPDITKDTIMFRGFENGVIIYHAPAVSYLSFLICNNTVIVPEYFNDKLTEAEKNKDELAGQIFSTLFPNNKIVRINPMPLNLKGGGIHRAFITQPVGIKNR